MLCGSSTLTPLRAVQNGATTLAESFLFLVGAGLVLGETYRSSRKEGKRRDEVQDRLEGLEEEVKALRGLLQDGSVKREIEEIRDRLAHLGILLFELTTCRNEGLEKVLATVVHNGLRAGWLSLGHQDGAGEVMPWIDRGGTRGATPAATRSGPNVETSSLSSS
jgi:hypothetical protein